MSGRPRIFVTAVPLYTVLLFLSIFSAISQTSQPRILLGNEVFCRQEHPLLNNKRLGLVINQTSLLPDGTPLVRAFEEKKMTISAIFVPEHGLSGDVVAGVPIKNGGYKGIPVYSLYGKTRRPLPDQLSQIDVLIYDIQDVGTRFYTYISTLKYVLESAAPAGIPVYVLDRPNPAGGNIIEGPCLQSDFKSFIGSLPIPVRYGLTIGELARMMKGEGWIPQSADLRVIPLEGWERRMVWKETGVDWIPPSPNIPSSESSLLFPGIALLGGIGINGGVGTDNPFIQFGAPWLETDTLLENLPADDLRGAELALIEYTPRRIPGKILQLKYQGEICRGIRIRVTDPGIFRSVRFSLSVLAHVVKHQPDKHSFSQTELNRLFGTDHLSRFVKGDITMTEIRTVMESEEARFRDSRRPYLLYD